MFDLCAPISTSVNQGRYLFLEGDMKYKDNVSKVRNDKKRPNRHTFENKMNLIIFFIFTRYLKLYFLQMDVHCFLLTDILLVCKQTAKKGHGNLKVRTFLKTELLIWKAKASN